MDGCMYGYLHRLMNAWMDRNSEHDDVSDDDKEGIKYGGSDRSLMLPKVNTK